MKKFDVLMLFRHIELDELEEIKARFENLSVFERFALITSLNCDMNSLQFCCKHNCLEILKYLVHQLKPSELAFLQATSQTSDTCLMTACLFGNLKIVSYLISFGVNINQTNDSGQTGLHFSAINGNSEIFKLLLDSNACFTRDKYGQTPLMNAASNSYNEIVDLIIERNVCSRHEAIFAYELLGCSLIKFGKFHKAVEYWKKSLIERQMEPKISKNLTFNDCEFTTEGEIDHASTEKLLLQSILVYERLFGKNTYTTVNYIGEISYALERRKNYNLAIDLLLRKIQTQSYSSFVRFYSAFDTFYRLFVIMCKKHLENDVLKYDVYYLKIIESLVNEVCESIDFLNAKKSIKTRYLAEFDDILVIFGCFVMHFACDLHQNLFDSNTIFTMKKTIYALIKYTTKNSSISIYFLQIILKTEYDAMPSWCYSSTLELLIECGAQVMCVDEQNGCTPLHIVCSLPITNKFPEQEKAKCIEILIQNGAHLDASNRLGQTPTDLLGNHVAKYIPRLATHLTLQCLAAKTIRKFSIPFDRQVPDDIAQFIFIH